MIGLVTPFRGKNFGTKLQAKAMLELVNGLGHQAEIIDYRAQWDCRPKVLMRRISAGTVFRSRIDRIRQAYKCRECQIKSGLGARASILARFDDENLRKSAAIRGFQALQDHAQRYSAVVCGSDQVWLPNNSIAEYYTLEFAPNGVKRVAYAPSFGCSQLPRHLYARYSAFLSAIDALSVREEQGRSIVREISGKDVPVVLDPTLLLGGAAWIKMLKERTPPVHGGYILCYFLGDNPEHRRLVSSLAREVNLPVVCFPHFEKVVAADRDFGDIRLFDVDPIEFIGLIRDARVVFTDSYHCSAFSIMMRRPFGTFERFSRSDPRSTNSRIHSLLGKLSLESQIVTGLSSVRPVFDTVPDFDRVEFILDGLRRHSKSFLQEALSR